MISFALLLAFTVKSTIIITNPLINPFDQSKIPYSYANIGTIPYGKTLDFDIVQIKDLDLCQPLSTNSTINHLTEPTYLLLDTSLGTCSFTTEAINAQQIGAKGIIFVSDLVNYYGKIVQVNDGNGRKVHITVLFISTQTYRQLITIKNIHVKAQYAIHKSVKVNLTVFISASGRQNYLFLRQFKLFWVKIKDYINFRPVYFVLKCERCQQKDCFISNDYCTFQMDAGADQQGQFILKEQLRQWNIWDMSGTEKYLQYIDAFDLYCSTNWQQSAQCGDQIMKNLQIQKTNVGGIPTGIMDEWRIKQTLSGFQAIPGLTINEELYAGSYDPEQIFGAICQSLMSPPEQCTGIIIPSSNKKVIWIIVSIIMACLLTVIIGFFIYKRCVKKQLTLNIYTKVNQLVAKYATEVDEHNKKMKNRTKMRLNDQL